MKLQKYTPAFTLVELIVVITIVWILSTVWFVSYSGYLTWARDSNRISQLTKLSDSLQVHSASKTLPLPDNKIDITASWTLIAYQGEVWVDVLETIDYTNGGQDPKDDSYYTYYLTKDRNSIQLMAMMEEQQNVAYNTPLYLKSNQTNKRELLSLGNMKAQANFEERYPKVYGRKLWVLTYNDDSNLDLFNTPANQITANAGWLDIVTTPIEYIAHISDASNEKIDGPGTELRAANPKASCRRIKQSWWARDNGIYTISPAWTEFNVYCDMETAWGWWTLLARSTSWGTGWFTIGTSTWDLGDLDNPYVLWGSSDISVKEIMLGTYTLARSIVNNEVVSATSASLTVDGTTLEVAGITWWDPGFQWEQGMIFVR